MYIEYTLHRTSIYITQRTLVMLKTLDVPKRRVRYEIVMRSSVGVRLYHRSEERDSRRCVFPLRFSSKPRRLCYARIGNVLERPCLARSRERRVMGRTWDASGLLVLFVRSGETRRVGIGLPARRSPDKEDKGPVLGAPPRAIISRRANRRVRDARNDVYVHAWRTRVCVYVRTRVYACMRGCLRP